MNAAHVIPMADLREHEVSQDCWCEPAMEHYRGVPIVIHNSADWREAAEELLGECLGPDKTWGVVEEE